MSLTSPNPAWDILEKCLFPSILSSRKLSLIVFSLLGIILLFLPGCQTVERGPAEAATTDVLLIEGATLIDGTGAPPVSDAVIVIEKGLISQVGEKGQHLNPPGAQVIQAAGKYVIPGLIDAHVHYQMPWLHRLYLANGVTTVRDLGGPIERLTTLRQEIGVGNILGPRMFITGPPINPFSLQAMNLQSAREMASKLAEAGMDGVKVTGYTPEELAEIVEIAHANQLLVFGHTGPKSGNRAPGARKAIQAGLDGIEHALGVLEDSMDGEVPVPPNYDPGKADHIFRYWYGRMHTVVDSAKMEELIQMMVTNEVYFAPTLVNFEANFVLRGTSQRESNPALEYIPEDEPDRFGPFGEQEREEWKRTLELMQEATDKFHKAGGLLSAGTDSPGAALPGWSLHREMELFVQAGLTPMEALKTATLNNAEILGKTAELGSIEEGKSADLVILEGNPFEEISNTRRIYRVIRQGNVLDPKLLLEENLRQFGKRGQRTFSRSRRQADPK